MLNRFVRAFTTGQTFFVPSAGISGRNRDLQHCNDCIATRLEAAYDYTFKTHEDMASAIVLAMNTSADPVLRHALTTDESLVKLLQLNQALGTK